MNVKESESKKTQKKQPEKKKEMKVKPPTPKSLEMAVRLVSYFYRQQMLDFTALLLCKALPISAETQ